MSYNPYSLSGKTILITGAAGGLGRSLSLVCAKLGARVILTDIREDALKDVLDSLPMSESVDKHLMVKSDLTDEIELKTLVDQLPKLDGLVCNAGVMKLVPVKFINAVELKRIQDINLNAPILLTGMLLKKKLLTRGSSIVFTASAAGVYRVSPANGIYATTKCGIDAIMRTIALEYGPRGIRCNSVNPSMIETPLIKNGQLSPEELEREKLNYPLRRFAQPEEISLSIAFLLSDASSFITGTSLKIDGGMTLS